VAAPRGTMMEKRENQKQADTRDALTSHLIEAIEQVRLDMARVELWAYAVRGFSQPVPDYDPTKMKGWLPPEQAKRLDEPGRS
jgi:hypothetical protein